MYSIHMVIYLVRCKTTVNFFFAFFDILGQNKHFWKIYQKFFSWECDMQFITLLAKLYYMALPTVKMCDNSEYHMYAYQQNTPFSQPYIPSYTLADPAD